IAARMTPHSRPERTPPVLCLLFSMSSVAWWSIPDIDNATRYRNGLRNIFIFILLPPILFRTEHGTKHSQWLGHQIEHSPRSRTDPQDRSSLATNLHMSPKSLAVFQCAG